MRVRVRVRARVRVRVQVRVRALVREVGGAAMAFLTVLCDVMWSRFSAVEVAMLRSADTASALTRTGTTCGRSMAT